MRYAKKNWNYGPGDPVTWGPPVPGTCDPRIDDFAVDVEIENIESDIADAQKELRQLVDSCLDGEIAPKKFLTEYEKLKDEIEDLQGKLKDLHDGND